jgi:autotransporter-associated beta strand protein
MSTFWNRLNATWHRCVAGRSYASRARISHACRPILELLEDRFAPSVNVVTFHNDNQSWGVNSGETILTPSNVNTSMFGKQYAVPVDGQVYSQPLVATNIAIANGPNTVSGAGSIHDVVFVATEHDSVYAIDTVNGSILWKRSFIDTSAGYIGSALGTNINNSLGATGANGVAITTVPQGDTGSADITVEVGITGTPVIDVTTNTMYVVAKTKQNLPTGVGWVQQLHAINLADGTDKMNPYTIGVNQGGNNNTTNIYTNGTGDGSVGGVVKFNALREHHRGAISLVNNQIYLQWASHGDNGPYHGFVARFSIGATDFGLTGVINTSPNNGLSGIWMGGGKLTFELDGSAFYFETGNGSGGAPTLNAQGFPTNANYNEALVKVINDPATTPASQNTNGWGMKISDYFIPNNVVALDNADSDFGSGAPIILPDSEGIPGHPHLMLASGKEGKIYVIDRDNMGKYNAAANQVVSQTGGNAVVGSLSTPAYFNNKVYWLSGYSGPTFSYTINDTTAAVTTTSQTPTGNFGYLAGSPSVSANGTLNGIVWAPDRNANLLHAYSANSLATELWASNQAVGGGDNLSGAVIKFAPPTVANGQVFVATSNALNIYGLKQNANAAPNAPVLSATALSGSSINLTWTDSTTTPNTATSYSIEESTDGGTTYSLVTTSPAGATSVAIGGLTPLTTYKFRIRGNNNFGSSAYSNVATATTTSSITGLDFSSGFAGVGSALTLNGSAAVSGSALRLTNGATNQASSVFSTNPFDVTGFTTQFQFVTTAGANTADGLTFTIQGVGKNALGASGSSLGYGPVQGGGAAGIDSSVAIKFDLYNNAGEGSNSTGLYTYGAAPTNAGSIDLTGVPLDFHSGHTFQVNMTYLGTTLTVTIKDLTTNVTATQNYNNLQISTIVGGSAAYVGFTAATGGSTATQDILNWTYQPTAAASPNAPSGLGATAASATSVALSWTNNAANQTSFNLDRATDANFTQNLITQNLPATPFTFTDTALGLNPGGTYYYRIRAFNSAGSSANSNVASVTIPVPPPKPTDQQITEVTDSTISMSWTDNAGHLADGYHILRAVNHGTFSLYASLPLTSRPAPSTYEWTDGDPANNLQPLVPGNFYEYHIVAYNTSGNNDFAGVNATTRLKAPTLVYSQRTGTSATLFFTTDPLATSYNIYRGNSSGAETLLAPGVSGSPYVDNTLSPGGTYFYYVTAVNGNAQSVPIPNESAPSNESSPSLGGGTFQWTGNGADNKWSTAANWLSNTVPLGNGNETLVFPTGAAKLANVDDLPAGANAFAGIVASGAGYSFTINNNIVVGSGGITMNATGANTFIAASSSTDIYLASNSTFQVASGGSLIVNPDINEAAYTLTVSGAGNATFNAGVLGTSGGLTVSSTGTVALNGNSTYTGPTNVTSGTVNTGSNNPFGVNTDVTIASGAVVNATGVLTVGVGLAGSFYNESGNPNSANFNSLAALNAFYNPLTPNLTMISSQNPSKTTFDFAADGSAFPAPYNAGANNFTAIWRGKFEASVAGSYLFDTASDDGSMIYIDGAVVVNNNFYQGVTTRSGSVNLTAGVHDIVIAFYQGNGGYGMYADVQVPGGVLQRIPNSMLDAVVPASLSFKSLSGGGTFNLGTSQLTVGTGASGSSTFGTLTGASGSVFTKTGSSTLAITTPNYASQTLINGGTLQLGNGTSALMTLPTGAISNQAALVIANPSNTLSYAGAITGTGSLTVTGAGTLNLSGQNTYTGATNINGGTVNASTPTSLGQNSAVTVATGANLNFPTATYAGLIGTYYNSAPNNPPTASFNTLAALNAYIATLPIITTDRSNTPTSTNGNGTVFDYGNNGAGFPAPILANPNQFVTVWTGSFNAATAGSYTFATGSDDGSMIYIDGAVVVNNNFYQGVTERSGAVTLTAGLHNIVIAYYEGGGGYGMYANVQVPGGTLVRLSNSLLSSSGNVTLGSLAGGGNVSIANSGAILTVGGNNTTSNFSGVLSGPISLVKTGTGIMTLSNANTYTGTTTVTGGGVLVVSNNSALGNPSVGNTTTTVASGAALALQNNVSISGINLALAGSGVGNFPGALTNVSGNNSFAGSIAFSPSSPSTVTLNSLGGTMTLGGPINMQVSGVAFAGNGNTTVNGIISGTGTAANNILTQGGTGVVTLGSAPGNTYTGATTINSGKLLINNSSNSGTGTGNVSVRGGTLAGSGRISGTVTADTISLLPTATVAPGNSPGILSTGSLSLSNDAAFIVELNGPTAGNGSNNYDQANVTGTVALNGGSVGAGATLNVSVGYNAIIGQTFTIINNDGSDAVTGLFRDPLGNTLAEGATFLAGSGANAWTLKISYVGNSGNDVVLTIANPTITSVTPSSGPAAGGTTVTITGTNFTGASAIQFGAVNGTIVTVDSNTQITATTPASAAGTVFVTVINNSVTTPNNAAAQFTFIGAPAVTSVAPTFGPVVGGTLVTITGTGFTGVTAVKFGTVNAISYTVNTATQITATAPAGAAISTVDVTVTTPGGTSAASVNSKFTYAAAPVVSSPTVTGITGTSATLGGSVTNDGGLTTTRGVVYSLTSANSIPTIGGAGVIDLPAGSGIGTFTVGASSLTPGASYSFAAYAVNSLGTVYTTVSTFTTLPAPKLLSTAFNGATPELLNLPAPYTDQHSMVRSFQLTFDLPVALAAGAVSVVPIGSFGAIPGAITLTPVGGPGPATVWNVTFSGANTHGGSLADGQYNLTVDPTKVTSSGVSMTSAPPPYSFYVLFGESDGNHTVNNVDIVRARTNANTTSASPSYLWLFDYDWNGTVNNIDIIEVRRNAGRTA